jgi:glycosyltransferase involved in cell wall biosynthesis
LNLIINASTLSATGVTQVAVSFIYECIKFTDNIYHVFMSRTVDSQIDKKDFPGNFYFYLFESHPFYELKGIRIRSRLRRLEKNIKPDCVFSVFGPSCWTPKVPHLMGYAQPYYVYPESPLFGLLNIKEKIQIYLVKVVYKYFLKKNGKYFVCETKDVSKRLADFLGISSANIFTVTNTVNGVFMKDAYRDIHILPKRQDNEFRFLSLCSFMRHKNLTILNLVIPLLKRKSKKTIRFVLTVDRDTLKSKLTADAMDLIINIGRIDIKLCPQLYKECDALFLPTLMECFSANYPESMYMEKPILTSYLPFATTSCNDAALYFDPLDPDDICEKIMEIVENKTLYNSLVEKGKNVLKTFDTAEERAAKYLEICECISKK